MFQFRQKSSLTVLASNLFILFALANFLFAGESLTKLEKEIKQLIDSSKVSVVTVTSRFSHDIYVEKESGILSFFKTEFEKQELTYVNVGTGIVVDASGHILTRSSIVLGADSNTITLTDGTEIPVDFVGHHESSGFAVLKRSDSGDLRPAHFGNSDAVVPGSGIVMIGNSLGVLPSVAIGAVNVIMSDGTMQISANLNPGNNGSPILNFQGEVIGLVAGRLNVEENLPQYYSGLHYNESTLAYPINWIKRIADEIIQFGYVRKGWLGVVGYRDGKKPKIKEIKKNSPAHQAGLIEGDIILSYSSTVINNIAELAHLVESTRPGNRVPVEFMRADQVLRKEIEIGEKAVPKRSYAQDFRTRSGARIDGIGNPLPQQRIGDLLERNHLLELRINYLESELEKLKSLIESK